MKRSGQIARRTPLNPAKTKARKKRNQENANATAFYGNPKPAQEVDEAYKRWIRLQLCVVSHLMAPECCHVKTNGSGGSDYDTIPLSAVLHAEQHRTGFKTFAKKYSLDYGAIIDRLNRCYEQETGKAINRRVPV